MKSALVILAMCLATSAVLAEGTVTLVASPDSIRFKDGQKVILTAAVTFGHASERRGADVRYTFEAQKTWPCQEQPITISSNSSTPQFAWSAPKAGYYTFTVKAVNLRPASKPMVVEPLGSASVANYRVRPKYPEAGVGGNIKFSYKPFSGAAPIAVKVLTSIIPADPALQLKTRWKFYCNNAVLSGGCNPDQSPVSDNAWWMTTMTSPGQKRVGVDVDIARLSDCTWLESRWHVQNYGFTAQ